MVPADRRGRCHLTPPLCATPSNRAAALAATRGNQIRAADLLGVNRNTLRKKIRDLDIQVVRTSN
jgi:DNA-binding NtrC family response regulator